MRKSNQFPQRRRQDLQDAGILQDDATLLARYACAVFSGSHVYSLSFTFTNSFGK
ncbi:MAG: hypothetical protein R2795_26365 [Saprospiraceae bacterium]